MAGNITVFRDGVVGQVVLDRPEKLNALTKAMWRALGDAIRTLSQDDYLRCIVVRGAGHKAFSPGNDIGEFPEHRSSRQTAQEYDSHVAHALEALDSCRHPLIAQIRGACVGGGLVIAASCDIRISADSGRFGIPISRLGLVLPLREMGRVLRLIGPGNLSEMLLEGTLHSAEKARETGLINRVVSEQDLDDEVLATAARIAQGAPLAARWHKRFIKRLQNPVPLEAPELAECYDCYETGDFAIGYQAFLDKKKPVFRGN